MCCQFNEFNIHTTTCTSVLGTVLNSHHLIVCYKILMVAIIESVDSICRDSAGTQYNYANTNKFLKISKTAKVGEGISGQSFNSGHGISRLLAISSDLW